MINFYALGMDPRYWKEPNEFRPERFLEKQTEPGTRKSQKH